MIPSKTLRNGLAGLLLLISVGACSDLDSFNTSWEPVEPSTSAPGRPAPVEEPSFDEPASSFEGEYPPMPGNLTRAQVIRVVDGDTVNVRLDGRTERLRLIGLDTPEKEGPYTSEECFGEEASQRAFEVLDGQAVLLEADESQGDADEHDRLLRYLWLPDGRLFNLEMVAGGYAREYTYNRAYRYQDEFNEAEQGAREQERGFWSPDTCDGRR